MEGLMSPKLRDIWCSTHCRWVYSYSHSKPLLTCVSEPEIQVSTLLDLSSRSSLMHGHVNSAGQWYLSRSLLGWASEEALAYLKKTTGLIMHPFLFVLLSDCDADVMPRGRAASLWV